MEVKWQLSAPANLRQQLFETGTLNTNHKLILRDLSDLSYGYEVFRGGLDRVASYGGGSKLTTHGVELPDLLVLIWVVDRLLFVRDVGARAYFSVQSRVVKSLKILNA